MIKQSTNHFDTFVLRAPLLSLNFYNDLTNIASDNRNLILSYFEESPINAAIKTASPSLYQQLSKLINGKAVSEKEENRLIIALAKYLMRMSTRPTPFGALAGCCSGEFGSRTNIVLDHFTKHKLTTRRKWLDTNITNDLRLNFLSKKDTKWFPNSSLYQFGANWRYLEIHFQEKGYEYSSEEIEGNQFISKVISEAKNGVTFSELSNILQRIGVSALDADSYLRELVVAQVIEPYNLRPLLNSEIHKYEICTLEQWTPNPISNVTNDLFLSTKKSQLSEKIKKDIYDSILFLRKITPNSDNKSQKKFKEEFVKRYGEQELPLSKVLDPEFGIDYIESNPFIGESPLLSELDLKRVGNQNSINLTLDRNIIVLNNKLQKALLTGETIIELTDDDFNFKVIDEIQKPVTCCAFIELTQIGDCETVLIKNIHQGNAAKMIARFGYGDIKIQSLVNEIVELEEEMGEVESVLAEIVHLPSQNSLNIVSRFVKRKYEIPYFGTSSKDYESKIEVDDIFVTVRDKEIILKSKKLNKTVIPINTNVHNYKNSPLAIYQFLCDFGVTKNENILNFTWGGLKSIYRYFPRVTYKSVILNKAFWIFKIDEVPKSSDVSMEKIASWRENYKLPRFLYLVENDNKLLIDFQSELLTEVFYNEIKKEKWIILEECLFDKGSAVTDINGNGYANELLVIQKY